MVTRSSRLLLKVVLAAGLTLVIRPLSSSGAQPPLTEAAARQAVLARLHALQAIELDYAVDLSHTPPAPVKDWDVTLPNGTAGSFTLDRGVRHSDDRFAFLKGMSRWETRPEKPPATIRTYRPGIAEQLVEFPGGDRNGRVFPSAMLPLNEWVGLALGLRDADDIQGGPWFTNDALNAMAYARDKDGRVVLSRTLPRGDRQELTFDPGHEYALVSHRLFAKGPGAMFFEAAAADFRPVDGVGVPFTMTARIINLQLKAQVLLWEAHVTRCEVNGKANTEERYRIAWPKGIDVVDTRQEPPVRITVQHAGEKTPD